MSKKTGLSVESYKGVRDFYPEDQAALQYIFEKMREVAERFGYVEYHASVLEPAELYKAKGAENEELVNEQTYTFTDRGGREVTLRPEMTPTVARMVAAKRREMGFPLRLYSIPNLFRYERPQHGRLREHWQFNVDIFGSNAVAADAEIIAVAHALLIALGATEKDFTIKLGSRDFLDQITHELKLSQEDAKKLRNLMDRRAKMPQDEFAKGVEDLGVAIEILSPHHVPHDVAQVLELLRAMGVTNAIFDPTIVRGFDYYNGVVFEVFDTHPDNNRAMFGGGRYNGLVSLYGDDDVPAVGCAAGDVTLRHFLEVRGLLPTYVPPTQVYLTTPSPEIMRQVLTLAEELRTTGATVAVDFGDKKLGDQIKTAAKHKIPFVVVVGENEIKTNAFPLRNLHSGEEKILARDELLSYFKTH
jgi:histidyl-tRNA synthetase